MSRHRPPLRKPVPRRFPIRVQEYTKTRHHRPRQSLQNPCNRAIAEHRQPIREVAGRNRLLQEEETRQPNAVRAIRGVPDGGRHRHQEEVFPFSLCFCFLSPLLCWEWSE